MVTAVKHAGRNSFILELPVYLSEFTHGLAYLVMTQPSYLMYNVNVVSTYHS